MFRTVNKPFDGETTLQNVSLFSSKQEWSTEGYRVESAKITADPMCTQAIGPVREDSPDLGMMIHQLLLTPEKPTSQYSNDRIDSMMEKEFKNLEWTGAQSMSIWNTNRSCSEIDKKAFKIRSLLASKYLQGFGCEPKSGGNWDENNAMISGESPRETDFCFSGSEESEGSFLSISLSRSISISPSFNELSEKVNKNVSSASSAQTYQKEVPAKFERARAMCRQQSNTRYQFRGPGREMFNTKNRRKHVRWNQSQRWTEQTNFRTRDNRKFRNRKDQNRVVSTCGGTSQNNDFQVNDNISTSWRVGNNNKRAHKRGIRDRFAREGSARGLTLGDTLQKLMNKPKMLLAFVTDKEGSRFLQENLMSATTDQLWSTFTHLQRHFVTISQDVFGNYVVQKYLEFGSDKLRGAILETLQTSISLLSLEKYGSRVVQKLLDYGAHEQKLLVAKQLTGSIIKFVYDQNGNHVVQKIIQCLNANEIGFVVDEISGYTYKLAMHPYGSRVIQRLLEKISRISAQPLLEEIKQHTIALSQHQYGNYLIQGIIKHSIKERREVIGKLIGRVAELSREKYASNVIELAIKRSNLAEINELAKELLEDESRQTERFPTLALLVNDQYGNYVIQTLLIYSSGVLRQRLLNSLSMCSNLKKDYGRNLLLKVEQILRRDTSNRNDQFKMSVSG